MESDPPDSCAFRLRGAGSGSAAGSAGTSGCLAADCRAAWEGCRACALSSAPSCCMASNSEDALLRRGCRSDASAAASGCGAWGACSRAGLGMADCGSAAAAFGASSSASSWSKLLPRDCWLSSGCSYSTRLLQWPLVSNESGHAGCLKQYARRRLQSLQSRHDVVSFC